MEYTQPIDSRAVSYRSGLPSARGTAIQARQSSSAPVTQRELDVRRAPLVMRDAVVVDPDRGYSAAMQSISTSELPGIPPAAAIVVRTPGSGPKRPRNTSFIAA